MKIKQIEYRGAYYPDMEVEHARLLAKKVIHATSAVIVATLALKGVDILSSAIDFGDIPQTVGGIALALMLPPAAALYITREGNT